jgi:coenzyme F420-reducing hydrogenase delta subunit
MSDTLKVEGHTHLVRDVNSNAIVNTNVSEYQLYMKRIKVREKQSDELRNAVKEINNLKNEIREIKNLVKEIVK